MASDRPLLNQLQRTPNADDFSPIIPVPDSLRMIPERSESISRVSNNNTLERLPKSDSVLYSLSRGSALAYSDPSVENLVKSDYGVDSFSRRSISSHQSLNYPVEYLANSEPTLHSIPRQSMSSYQSLYTANSAREANFGDPESKPVSNGSRAVESERLGHSQKEFSDEDARLIYINDPARTNERYEFTGNSIQTSKYTVLTFFPKNLFEQFHRVAYVYFLIIVVLNQLPRLAVFGRGASILPLAFVLLVSAIKDAFEDFRRHRSDKVENNRFATVLVNDRFQLKKWRDIQVGEIIRICSNHTLPCDIVLLSTSDPTGVAYVQTINLDGESNLKTRYAKQETLSKNPEEENISGVIKCDKPNRNIYGFQGTIEIDGKKLSLGPSNIILRGCELKNTDWGIGVVVYAGRETKAMLNNAGAPSKRSRLETRMNREIILLSLFLIALCTIVSTLFGIWLRIHLDEENEMPFYRKKDNSAGTQKDYSYIMLEVFFAFLMAVIVFQIMIPISLYISMELVRVGQAYFMNQDNAMFDESSGSSFQCRALNVNEDLGQIKYVFSDKTGTLTENKMEFKCASIRGANYSSENATEGGVNEVYVHVDRQVLRPKIKVKVDPNLQRLIEDGKDTDGGRCIHDFFLALAACNTIVPIVTDSSETNVRIIDYQGESPDEQALVYAAAAYGFTLVERTSGHIVIDIQGHRHRFDVLGIHEFDSDRKRMSVILGCPDETVKVFVKGADTAMFSVINKLLNPGVVHKTETHLHSYSTIGLRTLVIGMKKLESSELERWQSSYEAASNVIMGRVTQLRKVASSIEKDLDLLGATAIEDRLQPGVPEAIESLRVAGIKVWVLTGDKQETAISIGYSSKLLTERLRQIVINCHSKEECRRSLRNALTTSDNISSASDGVTQLALIIDGSSLVYILDSELEEELFMLASKCAVVLCCRVAPLQKAGIVALVKNRTDAMTLAIGDGANDVSMIQMADVGVGISGQEGRQAVMASDFSMGQFRFLVTLLLVHGHWNYQRMAYMILYNFYRNAVFVIILFWFTLFTAFTLTTAINEWSSVLYSVLYTSVPTIVVATLDNDLSRTTLLKYPQLYAPGQKDECYNSRLFWLTMADTVWQSAAAFFIPLFVYWKTDIDGSGLGDLWTLVAVLLANLHLAMDVVQWNWVMHTAVWGSIVVTFICVIAIDCVPVLPGFWCHLVKILCWVMKAQASIVISDIESCHAYLEALLEGVSDALTKNIHLISSVKACLSYALLRASVSSSPVIFQHTAGIFAVLLLRFRENLKGEIGVLFPLIVLRYLDNADNQRLSVLRMLEKVCKDPQMLIDLYVNYDCDLSAPNLSERMVKTLSKIAQGTHFSDPNSVAATQNDSVKNSALQCLVNMLKSLVNRERSRKDSEKRNTGSSSLGNKLSDAAEKETRVEVSSDFEKAKAHKSTVESAIAEFNRQPGKGIEYLVANKLVENTPTSVAEFLKTTSNLDKALVGDYLGQHEEFPRSVMHAYVDFMNFSGMKFDAAVRELLSGFRLPRDAQKIDRIVEKFSERYCADNPSLFGNADTAYVLAYAVLVLNTNAHNPTVSSKMSKADFIHMNSTEAEWVPPKELLEEIYDSVVNEEIKLNDYLGGTAISVKQKPEVDKRGRFISILNLTLPRRKSVDKKSESDAIIEQTQSIFRNQGAKWGMFHTSHKVELIRPMVEAVGWSLLATFSVIMEEGDNKSRVLLCMEGFKAGIHITHVLEMDTMRYAFLTSLVRFTFLHAPKDMRSKNVEALRTLLELCESDTNSLIDSWNAVMECISRLEFITSSPSISATVGANQNPREAVVPSLRELAGKPTEQVFLNTTKLPSDGIVEFFTALCGISAEELKQTPSRVFSLQKLVEISYYNMARIRLVWARIWVVLSNHFVSAGSHHDEKVALYAIDSLRQLGMKYLERVELANFTFQNDIMKPFVALMRNSRSESTRRLIIDCVVQMINSKVATIKSGWRSVFVIFMAAADDESETIVESAFENVEQVILEHFDQVIGECFLDCVNCLIGFANNKSSDRTSLKAIALLRIYENHLAEGLVPGGALNLINKSRDEGFDVTEHYWFPMLAGLSDLTSDTRAEVRNCALEVLFDLLNERGSKFSPSFWESIFRRVLFPIFDQVRHAGKGTFQFSSDDEWLHETCIHSLQLLCNLFNTFYKEVSFMLPPLLSLLLDCTKKTDQSVVSIALGALVHLIEVGGHQFSDSDWGTLLKSIRDASYATQPLELLNDLGFQCSNMPNHLGDTKPDGGDGVVNGTGYDPIKSRKIDNHETASMSHPDHNNDDDSLQSSASGSSSPSISSQKPTDSDLQRSQTFGQRIMGNRFLRSFTSKQKDQELNGSVQSLSQLPEATEDDSKYDEESPLLTSIRGKCVTQLLLLSAIDSIQKKYWSKLKGQQKVTIMEILVSMLDFAASYNSYANLRLRMHHIPVERPPMNLLRQELVGTCVYLDILQKTISAIEDTKRENSPEVSDFRDLEAAPKLGQIAEEKMVSFCQHVLKDASDFQYSVKGTTNMEIHRVLELRSPIIVKVINGMSSMNSQIFKKHLGEFYPLLTKLLCCDQMAIRGALGDLFRIQLSSLLP